MQDYPNGNVALIAGITLTSDVEWSDVEEILVQSFGTPYLLSDWFDFSHFTNYYQKEMGNQLQKRFIAFTSLVPISNAHRIKISTNQMEHRWKSMDGNRMVNVDPGYITLSKLILFTTKDYSHRIFINEDIYAEITLSFSQKTFHPLPTTYPDYNTPLSLDFFTQVRGYLHDFL